MSFELAEGHIDLTTNTRGFDAVMAKVRAKLQRIEAVMQRVSAAARRMLFVTGAATGYFVNEASKAEEMTSKFNAVFKNLSADASDFAKNLAKDINRSKYDLMEYMAVFQDTFVPLGFARDQAAETSKKVTELAEDLASFNNLPTVEVVKSLQSALVGNHETVRKFGVVITQATLDQELLNMGIRGGVRAATEQEKALARLNIIMASTTDAQGDAKRTAGSFANQLRGAKAVVRDLSIEIGSSLIPSLSQKLEKIKSILLPIAEWVSKNKELTARLITLNFIVLTIAASLPLMTGGMWIAEKAAIAFSRSIILLTRSLIFLAQHPLIAIASALAILTGYLIYTRLEGETFREKMVSAAENVSEAFTKLKEVLGNLFAPVLPIWNTAITWIKQVMFDIGFVFRNFDALVEIGVLKATLTIVKFSNDVKYWFTDALPDYLDWFRNNWKNVFMDILNGTKAIIINLGKNIWNFISAVKDAIAGKGWNFEWTGLLEGFERTSEKLPEIAERVATPLENALREQIDEALKPLSEKYAVEKYGIPDVTMPAEKAQKKMAEGAEKAQTSVDSGFSMKTPAGSSKDSGVGFSGVKEMWSKLATSLTAKDIDKKQLDESKKHTSELKKSNQHLEKIAKNSEKKSLAVVGP